MRFTRRLGAGILLTVLALLFLTTLGFTLASLSQATDSTRIESETAAQPPGGGLPPPSGSQTTVPIPLAGAAVANIACYRAASGAMAGSYVVQVDSTSTDPEQITVAIDLVGSDGGRQPRTVVVALGSDDGTVTMIVSDSNGATPFVDCRITAIQRGQRLILTGN